MINLDNIVNNNNEKHIEKWPYIPVEQAKFEYSPLGKIFNKGLSEYDKKG